MSEYKISDIPTIQKMLRLAQTSTHLNSIYQRLVPFSDILEKIGVVDKDLITKNTDILSDISEKMEYFAILPDKFNDYFGNCGWIIYENLNLRIAAEAISLAEAGDMPSAEQILVDYFTPDIVEVFLNEMNDVNAFKPRFRLARLALKDYEEERYHACIPVILALTDGLVNELNNGKGFFSKETDLEAWNSISAHKRGLVELGRIFRKGRKKTSPEQITIPYRHGILHGMDLGYDNKIVAAKVWAALFAVRTWAIKAERNELEEPPSQPQLSLMEKFKQLAKNQETKRKIAIWKPRTFPEEQIFLSEVPSDYEENTPERKLVEFLHLWKVKNYGHMAGCVQAKRGVSAGEMPKHIQKSLGEVELIGFQIVQISDTGAAATDILVTLQYTFNQSQKQKDHKFRLLYMNDKGKVELRSEGEYQWYVSNWNYFHPY